MNVIIPKLTDLLLLESESARLFSEFINSSKFKNTFQLQL